MIVQPSNWSDAVFYLPHKSPYSSLILKLAWSFLHQPNLVDKGFGFFPHSIQSRTKFPSGRWKASIWKPFYFTTIDPGWNQESQTYSRHARKSRNAGISSHRIPINSSRHPRQRSHPPRSVKELSVGFEVRSIPIRSWPNFPSGCR